MIPDLKRKFEYQPQIIVENKKKKTEQPNFNEIQINSIDFSNDSEKEMMISSKEMTSDMEEEPLIKWVEINEIQKEIFNNRQDSFKIRIDNFANYLDGAKGVYINLENAKCIFLSVKKTDQFKSEAFSKDFFQESPFSPSIYHTIKVHECIEENDEWVDRQIIKIRCSENGLLNELVKIQSGKTITGTEGMQIFEEKIVPWFKLKKVFLYDDAFKSCSKTINISLRKNGIFLRDGSSWYERLGYSLHPCDGVIIMQNISINQNIEHYQAAKDAVCNTSLKSLLKYVKPSTQNWLKSELSQATTTKEFVENLNSEKRYSDLARFYKDCMNPTIFKPNSTNKDYLDHLKVIEDARIYAKDFIPK